jgi:hypothetical protein
MRARPMGAFERAFHLSADRTCRSLMDVQYERGGQLASCSTTVKPTLILAAGCFAKVQPLEMQTTQCR